MSGRRTYALADLPQLVGTIVEGATMTVSRAERDAFDAVTHVTEAYPEPDPPDFPADIVEGFHTLALIDAVSRLVMRFDPATTYGFNYGLDRVRFMAPVPVGRPLHSTIEVREVVPRGEGYLVLRRITLTVERAERPSMVADWWVLVLPQSSAGEEV